MSTPFAAATSTSSSIDLGRVFGIRVRLHTLWFLLIPLAMMSPAGAAFGVALLLAAFACVFLHELGHSVAAQRFGIRVVEITLWPLGGMAKMESIPEDPKIEGIIAVAGPAVNVVLAIVFGAAAIVFGGLGMEGLFVGANLLVSVNLMLGVFNLAPAFPMDGGRVLRAWLARKRDWVTATEIAVRIGRRVIGFMLLLTLVASAAGWVATSTLCIMPLLAGFLWLAGGQELWAVRMRHGVNPLAGAFGGADRGPFGSGGGPDDFEDDGGAPRSPFEPSGPGPGAARPTSRSSGGLSDEDIAQIERFRGRLGRPHDEA